MTRIPELNPVTHWNCPNCPAVDATREAQPHTRFHTCYGLGGLTAPMVQAGTDVRVRAVESEDYVGHRKGEDIVYDENGRPVTAIVTERPDGSNDVAVLASCVNGDGKAGQ